MGAWKGAAIAVSLHSSNGDSRIGGEGGRVVRGSCQKLGKLKILNNTDVNVINKVSLNMLVKMDVGTAHGDNIKGKPGHLGIICL